MGKFLSFGPEGNVLSKKESNDDLPEAEDVEEIKDKEQSIDDLLTKLAKFEKEE